MTSRQALYRALYSAQNKRAVIFHLTKPIPLKKRNAILATNQIFPVGKLATRAFNSRKWIFRFQVDRLTAVNQHYGARRDPALPAVQHDNYPYDEELRVYGKAMPILLVCLILSVLRCQSSVTEWYQIWREHNHCHFWSVYETNRSSRDELVDQSRLSTWNRLIRFELFKVVT
jgi:hypothetical protein